MANTGEALFCIDVPEEDAMPEVAPGGLLPLISDTKGVIPVVVVAIEGRRIIFRNRTIQ